MTVNDSKMVSLLAPVSELSKFPPWVIIIYCDRSVYFFMVLWSFLWYCFADCFRNFEMLLRFYAKMAGYFHGDRYALELSVALGSTVSVWHLVFLFCRRLQSSWAELQVKHLLFYSACCTLGPQSTRVIAAFWWAGNFLFGLWNDILDFYNQSQQNNIA